MLEKTNITPPSRTEEREKSMKLGKVCMLGRKEYPKIFTEAEEKEV